MPRRVHRPNEDIDWALATGTNKHLIIEKSVGMEICCMLDLGKPAFVPKKGRFYVVMFVELQGSGKTTTCIKYAYFYQHKGFKPSLICADMFRADAFDQLKQNAAKVKIPFYKRFVATELAKDIIISIGDVNFYLHKGSCGSCWLFRGIGVGQPVMMGKMELLSEQRLLGCDHETFSYFIIGCLMRGQSDKSEAAAPWSLY